MERSSRGTRPEPPRRSLHHRRAYDHIGSLPSLIESYRLGGRSKPLHIWALPEVMAVAHKRLPPSDSSCILDNWTFDVSFDEVEHGKELILGGYKARILRMDHAVPSAASGWNCHAAPSPITATHNQIPRRRSLGVERGCFITESTFLRQHVEYARMTKHMTAYERGSRQRRAASSRSRWCTSARVRAWRWKRRAPKLRRTSPVRC